MTQPLTLLISTKINGRFKPLSKFIFFPSLSIALKHTYSKQGVSSYSTRYSYPHLLAIANRIVKNSTLHPTALHVTGSFLSRSQEDSALKTLLSGQKVTL